MQDMTRTGAVQIYAHSANAAFAERLAAALDTAGYEIVTGPFNQLAVDAVIVVWSGAAMGSARLLEAAREPLDCGVLVPVSIGMVEPPYGFQHLPPVNLGGWTGEAGDPRWRRVLEEIEAVAYSVRGPAPGAGDADQIVAAQAPRADVSASLAVAARVREYAAVAGAGAKALAAAAAPLVGAVRRVPRAPVAAGLVLTGVILLAGFLLITPNDAPSSTLAAAPVPDAAAPEAPPIIAAAQLPEAAGPEPVSVEAAAEPAPETPDDGAQDEIVLAEAGPDDLVLAELAEGEAVGDIIAEGDTDYPADEVEAAAAPETPNLAEGSAGDGGEHDRIASLIASSVSDEEQTEGLAGDDRETNAPQAEEHHAAPGDVFRDCPICPEMATIPAGSFVMGSPADEPARQPQEGPQVEVTIPRAFALGAKEVTFEQWDACVADGACAAYAPYDAGWGRGARPVVNVSWEDAQAYADWLSKKTGHAYRLPSEEEWEYAARAGAKTPFAAGAFISTDQANFDGAHPYGGDPGKIRGRTTPVGAFAANPFGLYDMNGNVWEWVADCWSASHENAPAHGEARGGACSSRVLKGGAWNTGGWRLRAGHRIGKSETAREYDNGFRVARDLG